MFKRPGLALEHARCRAKFMTCEIHDYRGCAHALVMRMIAVGSYISQLDYNKGLIPRQRNSSRETVYAKYGWLGMNDSIEFSHFFRLRSE